MTRAFSSQLDYRLARTLQGPIIDLVQEEIQDYQNVYGAIT